MAFQPSVVDYFSSRKRPLSDVKKETNPTKVLVLDETAKIIKSNKTDLKPSGFVKKIVFKNQDFKILHSKKLKPKTSSKPGPSCVAKEKKELKRDGGQMDIRKTLFKATNKNTKEKDETIIVHSATIEASKDELDFTDTEKSSGSNIPFHIKGKLSPAKSRKLFNSVPDTKIKPEDNEVDAQVTLKTPETSTPSSRKELNLGNIKAMMSRSSRLEEMKAALKRFNENKAKVQATGTKTEEVTLEEHGKIDLQISNSPMKTPTKKGHLLSPQGKLTPSRLFSTPPLLSPQSPCKSPMKSPAFQRYQALVTEGKPALVLPFKYRMLAELFRCVDTVASMLHHRHETITLSKLRPAVQEISRKTLTEYHLGQIKTVFPNAFQFTIEKMRAFGSAEKYELVMTPVLSDTNKEGDKIMSPSVLLARRRVLYNSLLDQTKLHHEEFLMCLEPPMCVPRARLTRWHPEFLVDSVPDIVSASLPQPPNIERVTTAKDVLERARNMFVVNPRMERALQKVSENRGTPTLSPPSTLSVTSTDKKPALHGVPASLLERVRAKQAARAVEAMTRSPAQAQEVIRLTRLPEMARIVRNLFVTEKKSVLPLELLLEKLADSYRESLTRGELDDHLKLLAEKTPGWITFCNLRKTDYVRVWRDADMNRIMARLEALATENCI